MRQVDQKNSDQEGSCGKQEASSSMEDGGAGRVTGIRQIVKLKEFIHKWQSVTLGPKEQEDNMNQHSREGHSGISPAISRRLRSSNVYCDSDEDSCASPEPPHGVPKGYLAVYVGPELRRFIIPTSYLSDPLFKVLLEKVEEEFGFDHCGGLTIPCEIETFKYLLNCMETHQREKLNSNDDTDPEGTSPQAEE